MASRLQGFAGAESSITTATATAQEIFGGSDTTAALPCTGVLICNTGSNVVWVRVTDVGTDPTSGYTSSAGSYYSISPGSTLVIELNTQKFRIAVIAPSGNSTITARQFFATDFTV